MTALFNNLVGSDYGKCMRSGLAMLGMIPEERLRESMSQLREAMTMELTEEQSDHALRFIQLLQRVLDLQEIRESLPMECIKITLEKE